MLSNRRDRYGWVAIGLHWLMALGIFSLFALGVWMKTLGYYDTWYNKAPDLHQSIGMLLFGLLLLRMTWAVINIKPVINGAPWEQVAGVVVHRLFYLLMLMIMVSGYLIPTARGEAFDIFGVFSVPAWWTLSPAQADLIGVAHRLASWAIMVLAALHMAAALKHHFVDKDPTLLRMVGISSTKEGA